MIEKSSQYRGVRLLILMFIAFSITAYLHARLLGVYNGDFLGRPVYLSHQELFIALIYAIVPFVVLWIVYRYFYERPISAKAINIPMVFFTKLLFVVYIASVILTLAFDVGVMATKASGVPLFLRPFVMLLNRIPISYLGILFLFITQKRRNIILMIIMLVSLGVLRAGLGIFLYIGLVFVVKYVDVFRSFIRKYWIMVTCILVLFPVGVREMYVLRAKLRNETMNTQVSIISGILLGRLSSFSNIGYIMQNDTSIGDAVKEMSSTVYQELVVAGFLGESFLPEFTPEKTLPKFVGNVTLESGSYMCGPAGILLMTQHKGNGIMMINALTMIVLIISTFLVLRLFNTQYSNEVAVLFLSYTCLSGVGAEFAFTIVVFLLFYVILYFTKRRHES